MDGIKDTLDNLKRAEIEECSNGDLELLYTGEEAWDVDIYKCNNCDFDGIYYVHPYVPRFCPNCGWDFKTLGILERT